VKVMEKRLSAWETRRQFGKVLREVARDGDAVIVESHGEPVAVVVPMDLYQHLRQERQAFFDDARATAARVNLSPEEADAVIAEAVAAVRAETNAEG
ncbi:MAG TPA: type II toxin-antitoxin system Phd/YefM family antitoxin, partial [Thermomicrobiales bacterium]|nr:type II toxin-antitoxin system Phd/YefM family antitoxin [Thermomicrobiales bacterium]